MTDKSYRDAISEPHVLARLESEMSAMLEEAAAHLSHDDLDPDARLRAQTIFDHLSALLRDLTDMEAVAREYGDSTEF